MNGVLENYRIRLRNINSDEVSVVIVSAISQTYTWFDLHPYYSYKVILSALTSAGAGPAIVKTIQMPEAGTIKNIHSTYFFKPVILFYSLL